MNYDWKQQRFAPRYSVFLPALLRTAELEIPTLVLALSALDALVETVAGVRVGEAIDLELPKIGWVGGMIIPGNGELTGIKFRAKIDPYAASNSRELNPYHHTSVLE